MQFNNNQKYAERLATEYTNKDSIPEKYFNELVLSECKSDSLTTPIVVNLTDFTQLGQRHSNNSYIYENKLSIKEGASLTINDVKYSVIVPTIRNITKREMVLLDLNEKTMHVVDLKNDKNIADIYNILKKQSLELDNKNKKTFRIK